MSLFDHLAIVDEDRSYINQKHNLVDVLFLILAAVSSGCSGWSDIQQFGDLKLSWLRQFRPFTHGIPRRHAIANIMRTVNTESLVLSIFSWVNEMRAQADKPLIAIDGKTIRGASKRSSKTFHSVGAYDVNNGLAIYQEMAEGKGQEIKTVQSVLSMLNISGALITLDALHAQRATLEAIINRGGNYVIQVKSNQKALFNAVKSQFDDAFQYESQMACYESKDKAHGREEKRITFQIPALFDDELQKKWPSVTSLVAVERHRKIKANTVIETSFYISSCEIAPSYLGNAIRDHWQIENSLHWVLDVAFREDDCAIYDEQAIESLTTLKRLAFNLAKQETTRNQSMKSKLHRASLSDEYRALMIFGNVKSV